MFARFLVALGVLAVAIDAFHGGIRLNRGFSVKLRNSEVCGSAVKAIPLSMATDGDDVGVVVKQSDDISKYSVGQTLNGELVSSKDFGIFVQIEGSKTRVLLPRSLLSRGEYAKLTNMTKKKANISLPIVQILAAILYKFYICIF